MKYYFALFVIVFSSCVATKSNTKGNDNTLITYSKTSCRGKCPVFTMTIYSNGRILFVGKENVLNIGKFEKQLSSSELDELIQSFNNSDFFKFSDKYTSHATDLPTIYISYSNGDKFKKIKDYFGAPEELKQLEKLLDKIVDTKDWKTME